MTPGISVIVNGNQPNMLEESVPSFVSRKPKKALANGTYLKGSSKFKIRKGSPIPEGVEVVYNEPQDVVTADEVFATRIATDKPADGASPPAKKETAKKS